MATRRKRSLNFLPAEPRAEPVIDIGAYPVDIGVGELMRLTRERLGHELQSVANQLRIRLSYLEAIEESRFRDLPGTTYAVGFVRSYADYLGLDGADIVRRFREEAARIHGQTKLILPALSAEGKLPRAAVLLVSVVGLAVLYGAWYYRSSQQESELPLITEVPDRLVALPPDPPAASGSAPVRPLEVSRTADPAESSTSLVAPTAPPDGPMASQAPAASVDPASSSVDTGSGVANAATPAASVNDPAASTEVPANGTDTVPSSSPTPAVAAPDSEPAVAEPPATAATNPTTTGPSWMSSMTIESIPPAPALPAAESPETVQQAAVAPDAAGTIVLEARMDSWVEIRDADGRRVFARILAPGERYEVPAQPGLTLKTGNAGGLDVLVDGQKVPPLGDTGKVIDKIALEPSRLLGGTATAN